ncbi:MAG: ABC transporter permease, partial [Candidatus Methanoperedenaceae archaeon]|nr:ABC transporter permease [Candidatus Methanoperedenaceae archaeon]
MRLRSDIKTAFFFARKDTLKNKRVFALIIIAIAFATANIIIINGFMDGFSNSLMDVTLDISSGHVNIYPKDNERYIEGLGIKELKLSGMENVVAHSPRLYSSGTLSYKGKTKTVKIVALDPEKERDVTTILGKITEGGTLTRENEILISYRLAEDLGAKAGGEATLVFENGNSKTYRIKGITRTGVMDLDANGVIMYMDEVNRILGLSGKASIIMVKLSDREMAEEYSGILKKELEVTKVKVWREEIEGIVGSMNTIKKMTDTVIAVGLFAAAVSVGVIIYVNVINRRRQIGIMKAIGMNGSIIFTVYLMEALFLAVIGVAGGDAIGYLGTKYLETKPFYCPIIKEYISAKFYTYLLYDASIISGAVVVLAGMYPAFIAGRTNIIKAIWGT